MIHTTERSISLVGVFCLAASWVLCYVIVKETQGASDLGLPGDYRIQVIKDDRVICDSKAKTYPKFENNGSVAWYRFMDDSNNEVVFMTEPGAAIWIGKAK